jgi:hypothetical protein
MGALSTPWPRTSRCVHQFLNDGAKLTLPCLEMLRKRGQRGKGRRAGAAPAKDQTEDDSRPRNPSHWFQENHHPRWRISRQHHGVTRAPDRSLKRFGPSRCDHGRQSRPSSSHHCRQLSSRQLQDFTRPCAVSTSCCCRRGACCWNSTTPGGLSTAKRPCSRWYECHKRNAGAWSSFPADARPSVAERPSASSTGTRARATDLRLQVPCPW